MSPVELLREAAKDMRREAEGLTAIIDDAADDTDRVPVEMGDALRRYQRQLPAVADWLDYAAGVLEHLEQRGHKPTDNGYTSRALAVARAYLGGEQS